MTAAARLLQRARADAGLSQRSLAARAGCPQSTIFRIEAGLTDPTVGMMQRLFAAAGQRFVTGDDDGPSLAAEAAEIDGIDNLDWTRLRGLVDWVEQHPDRLAEVIDEPAPRVEPILDAFLAALAETIAENAGKASPDWTTAVPPAPSPWRPLGTPRMQAKDEATTPRPFKRRNLVMGRHHLWRVRSLSK
jgi:transcriptional regulator with XRE-family HTH domain